MTADIPADPTPSHDIAALHQHIADLEHQLAFQQSVSARLQLSDLLIDQATIAIVVTNLHGVVQFTNPAARALYGFEDPDTMVGRSLEEFFVPDKESGRELLPRLLRDGAWQGELWNRLADEQHIWVRLSALVLTDKYDQPSLLALFISDITAAHKASLEHQQLFEELQRQANELRVFKTLVDNALDGIAVWSLDSTVAYANQAFQDMSGFGAQTVNTSFNAFYPPEELERVISEVVPALQKTGKWSGFILFQRPNGEQWVGQTSGFFLLDDQGTPIAQASIMRDMTDQQRAEAERAALQEQVIQGQQLALRELSTPLIPLADRVLVMPLIGIIDSLRAQQVVETLLHGVADTGATTVLLDITGVPLVDTQVAGALINSARAVKLLGAQIILTGIRPEVAQTLIGLGVDLSGIITLSSLQTGIAYALRGQQP